MPQSILDTNSIIKREVVSDRQMNMMKMRDVINENTLKQLYCNAFHRLHISVWENFLIVLVFYL
jgi:hypothetical protein